MITLRMWVPKLLLSCSLSLLIPVGCGPQDEDADSSPTLTPSPTPALTPLPTPSMFDTQLLLLARADVLLDGEGTLQSAGTSVALVGDLNGDGLDELAVGAPLNDDRQPDAGKVYVYFGDSDGLSSGNLGEAPASFQGEGREDMAGQSVVRGGDLNGDGLDDLLIGAPYNDLGGPDAGRVYVVFGRSDGWYPGFRLANAEASFYGSAGERIGELGSVAGGGDLNGDGFDDLVIGAPFNSDAGTENGKVYIIPGRASGWSAQQPVQGLGLELLGSDARDWAGFSVAIVPDVNGDAYADLLVGAPHASTDIASVGKVYLVLGKPNIPVLKVDISSAESTFTGVNAGEELGCSVGAGGDLNGDGLEDLVAGAWGNGTGGAGRFYLIPGDKRYKGSTQQVFKLDTVALARIAGSSSTDYLGRPGMGIGDLNGDGIDDLLLGSYRQNYAALFLGRSSWAGVTSITHAQYLLKGEAPADYAGYSVGGRGDLNGDGLADLVVGAFGNDGASAADRGRAYIFYGRSLFAFPAETP